MAGSSGSPQRLKGLLSVTVLKAKNLKKSDWFGENDCYVVLSLEPLTNKPLGKDQQSETHQKTQIHDGSHPIFNEKFVFPVPRRLDALYVQVWDADRDKDDLLGEGTLSLIDDEQGGRLDTNLDKEWLHAVSVGLTDDKGRAGSTLELVLHFIPESVSAYMGKKFDAAQAEVKKKLTQKIVGRMTDVASEKIRGYVGLGV
jgi:hypothetical protein